MSEIRLVAMRRNIVGRIVLPPDADTARTWDAGITERELDRVMQACDTYLLDYCDPDDGPWPEREEYIDAIAKLAKLRAAFDEPVPEDSPDA